MSIIIQAKRVEIKTVYRINFLVVDDNSQKSFDCDEDGNVDFSIWGYIEEQNEHVFYCSLIAREVYLCCLIGEINGKKVINLGIEQGTMRKKYDAVLRCDCGCEFELSHHFTNTCPGCDTDYDGSGHQLAPRHLWGEETGEDWREIYGI